MTKKRNAFLGALKNGAKRLFFTLVSVLGELKEAVRESQETPVGLEPSEKPWLTRTPPEPSVSEDKLDGGNVPDEASDHPFPDIPLYRTEEEASKVEAAESAKPDVIILGLEELVEKSQEEFNTELESFKDENVAFLDITESLNVFTSHRSRGGSKLVKWSPDTVQARLGLSAEGKLKGRVYVACEKNFLNRATPTLRRPSLMQQIQEHGFLETQKSLTNLLDENDVTIDDSILGSKRVSGGVNSVDPTPSDVYTPEETDGDIISFTDGQDMIHKVMEASEIWKAAIAGGDSTKTYSDILNEVLQSSALGQKSETFTPEEIEELVPVDKESADRKHKFKEAFASFVTNTGDQSKEALHKERSYLATNIRELETTLTEQGKTPVEIEEVTLPLRLKVAEIDDKLLPTLERRNQHETKNQN